MTRSCLSIVLAAGEGTRMKSSLPKVLHKMAGLPLVCHVVNIMQSVGSEELAVVVGRGAADVEKAVMPFASNIQIYEQKERLGTAHAVLAARQSLLKTVDDILIVFGDTPLIEAESLQKARNALAQGADIVVMGFITDTPTGYGRLIEENGKLVRIVEEKDASLDEKKINFCNGGLMAVRGTHLLALLEQVDNNNAKGEYYLTDIVAFGHAKGLDIRALAVPYDNVIGINTRLELAAADAIWQQRKRQELMLSGVTMMMPESIYFSFDTQISEDVVIEPNVYFGPGVKVGKGVVIHAFSHLEGADVGESAQIGPYARLRPGAELSEHAKVGNFCEVKNAKIGEGAKVNHLSYIGDASVGAQANIGAGTITCNYDGFNKWQTEIGQGAFIGSNSALVAPVKIGVEAYVASGSVITNDVPAQSLALGRARQTIKPDFAPQLRQRFAAIKAAKKK